jgi:hypothetical protein
MSLHRKDVQKSSTTVEVDEVNERSCLQRKSKEFLTA